METIFITDVRDFVKIVPGIIEIEPTGSKEERAEAASPYIRAGNVILPKESHFIKDMFYEFKNFPNSAHDDQVDATSQAVCWAFNNISIVELYRKAFGKKQEIEKCLNETLKFSVEEEKEMLLFLGSL